MAQRAAASACDREKKTGEEDQRWILKVGVTEEEFSLRSSRASVHVPSVATVTHREHCGAATSFPVPTVLLATRLNLSMMPEHQTEGLLNRRTFASVLEVTDSV